MSDSVWETRGRYLDRVSEVVAFLVALDRLITSWFVADAALLSYWEIAEAAQPGQQYASPYLPCAWMATMFAPIVFLTWRLIRTHRARRAPAAPNWSPSTTAGTASSTCHPMRWCPSPVM